MQSLIVRVPDSLAERLKRRVAPRQRSSFLRRLLEQALPPDQDDDPLYRAAVEVEQDQTLSAEMADWEATVSDGITTIERSFGRRRP